jgi:hypothetical protein
MRRLATFLAQNKLLSGLLLMWVAVQTYFLVTYPIAQRPMQPISWDTFGYYLYLPATFIYHDLWHLGFAEPMRQKYNLAGFFYAARIGPEGNYVMNYSLGTAILYSPFFFIGHLWAKLFNYPADGFSAPYQYSVFVGGVLYSLAGLLVTIRTLRYFFSQKITGLLLLILLAGTNYLYYTLLENAMTHNYLFTVGACIIYLSVKWHQSPRYRYAVLLGLFIGLAIIIRPTEIFWCLIPLLWTIKDRSTIVGKIETIKQNLLQLAALFAAVIVVGSIQMLYWKAASGKFIYYSYDGTFDFLSPHIIPGLFSIRKGWLVYTPVMALALIGLPLLWVKHKPLFIPFVTYTLLVVYITFSWHAWSYGGSFGCRPLVQSYALLLFPMGAFFQAIAGYRWVKVLLAPVIGWLLFYNCFQTYQYEKGYISHDGLTAYQYRMLFLKTHVNQQQIRQYFNLTQPAGTTTDSALVCRLMFNPADTVLSDSNAWLAIEPTGVLVLDTTVTTTGFNYLRLDAKAMFKGDIANFDADEFSNITLTVNGEITQLPLQPLIGNSTIDLRYNLSGWPGTWDNVYLYAPLPAQRPVQLKIQLKNPYYNYIFLNGVRISFLQINGM